MIWVALLAGLALYLVARTAIDLIFHPASAAVVILFFWWASHGFPLP